MPSGLFSPDRGKTLVWPLREKTGVPVIQNKKMKNEIKKFWVIHDERAENDAALKEGMERIRSLGHSVLAKMIEAPADASRYAEEAASQGIDTVVAVGGDGMLNLVVNGILRKSPGASCSVGLIPFGTGNDFATASGIPLDDPKQAFELLGSQKPVMIDIGQVNDTFFLNVVSGGFPAQAAAETFGISKELFGRFAYFLTGLSKVGNLVARKVVFRGPDFEWQGECYAFNLGNSQTAGGGFQVSPHARVNDGLLDLMIIPRLEEGLLPLVTEYSRLDDDTRDLEKLVYVQLPWVDLKSDEMIHLNLDGEPVEGRNFHFAIHPRRLSIHLPANSSVLHT